MDYLKTYEVLINLEEFFQSLEENRQLNIKLLEELQTFLQDEEVKKDQQLYQSLLDLDETYRLILRDFGLPKQIKMPGEYNENNEASVTVTSKLFPEKSITAKYTKEAADDLFETHGIDIRVELEKILKTQVEIEEARLILS